MLKHTAIPCCVARRSVSTCDHHQVILNGVPVSIRLGSHSHKSPLTRQAKSVVFGICQRQRSSARAATKRLSVLDTTRNVVPLAAESINCSLTEIVGTAPMRKRATIRKARTIIIGAAAHPHTTTRKWHTLRMGQIVSSAEDLPRWFITWMGIAATAIPIILNLCASVATRLRCMTVPATCPRTLRRYSQCPVKAGKHTLNYGEGPKKLAKTLGVSIDRAKELIEQYFKPYPLVREFIDGVHMFIQDYAMIETIVGRPRRFHEMLTIGRLLRKTNRWNLPGSAKGNLARAERQSVNSCIQGSAADVAKLAMIKCEFDPRLTRLGAEMLLQVHDELIFEVPEENSEEAMTIICDNMEHPFRDDLLVPLDVDGGKGYSWSSAKA